MQLQFEKHPEYILFSNIGKDITFDITENLLADITEKFDLHHRDVCIDFTDVNYVDSNGIGMISALAKHVGENGHRVFIINCATAVHRLFSLFKLDQIIQFARDNSLLNKNTKQQHHSVYIIENCLDIAQKNKIREIAGTECIFLSPDHINVEKIMQQHETGVHGGPAAKFFEMRTPEEVVAHLSDGFSQEILEEIILNHPVAAVRRDVILFAVGCMNNELYERLLPQIMQTEKNSEVLHAAAFAADELKKKS